jgi:galactonate dehydratase
MEAYQLPITIHDCSGPLEFAVAVHLAINAPNSFVQESVRAFLSGWYRELVTELPRVEAGFVYPLTGPGLGTALLPEVPERSDAIVRTTRAEV